MMRIRNTRIEDLDIVMQIYARARQFMAEHDNPKQWGATNWPPKPLIEDDIHKQDSYVCVDENDKPIGVFYYKAGYKVDPCYDVIVDGKWNDDENYGVVHRIASSGEAKGVGAFCINWAFEQCGHLRMDTHGDNYVMQSLLESIGFERKGIIYIVEDNDPRIAFEKI